MLRKDFWVSVNQTFLFHSCRKMNTYALKNGAREIFIFVFQCPIIIGIFSHVWRKLDGERIYSIIIIYNNKNDRAKSWLHTNLQGTKYVIFIYLLVLEIKFMTLCLPGKRLGCSVKSPAKMSFLLWLFSRFWRA